MYKKGVQVRMGRVQKRLGTRREVGESPVLWQRTAPRRSSLGTRVHVVLSPRSTPAQTSG